MSSAHDRVVVENQPSPLRPERPTRPVPAAEVQLEQLSSIEALETSIAPVHTQLEPSGNCSASMVIGAISPVSRSAAASTMATPSVRTHARPSRSKRSLAASPSVASNAANCPARPAWLASC